MYLAKVSVGDRTVYQIRQSYRTDEHSFHFRTIYHLGEDPRKFIQPFQDRIVLFHQDLVEAVSSHGEDDGDALLERLLWDFLPKETRQGLERFRYGSNYRLGPLSGHEKEEINRQVHIFDRRRLYYLRYGAVDQSRLSRLHEKCCRPLLGQSRDEREYYFTAEEKVLETGSYLRYVYAIFNLQKYFYQSFAPWLPESLAFDEMAEHLESELCLLNSDRNFWQADETGGFLHHHLTRYLIMFFDYPPRRRSFLEDFARSFMADHRTFRWPEKKSSRSPGKISEIFATSYDELKKMDREQLSRLYRQKAMQLHPDHGGDHDLFIELTESYQALLRLKGR